MGRASKHAAIRATAMFRNDSKYAADDWSACAERLRNVFVPLADGIVTEGWTCIARRGLVGPPVFRDRRNGAPGAEEAAILQSEIVI
ncbi:hypothetical protein GCM10007886_44960 [Methylobacterium gregans]|nr:hypothetical protein GCM10007886_44960 [Methylobacterium gregans]